MSVGALQAADHATLTCAAEADLDHAALLREVERLRGENAKLRGGIAAANPPGEPVSERPFVFSTPFGDVEGTEYFTATAAACTQRSERFVLCVQGKSEKLDVITEWAHSARRLAAAGWLVVLPNLHSNASTKPGTQRASEVSSILLAALEHFAITKPFVLCGKSWGGGQATQFAAAYPQRISRLVLVAPSLAEPSATQQLSQIPLLLFWAADDTVVSIDRAAPYTAQPRRLDFKVRPSGGHRVLDDYAATIVAFCASTPAGEPDPEDVA